MAFIETQEKSLLQELNNFLVKRPELKDLFLFAVNHKTAPVAVREKFAIPEYALSEASQNLKTYKTLKSFLLLSTCNRTEIYFRADDIEKALEDIYNFFAKYLGVEQKITKEYNTLIMEDAVVQQAFKVASGLDSLVLGESQVLSQVKCAYSIAQKEKTLDDILEFLFQGVIKTAKAIHKNTNISKSSQSISSAAIDLANKVCGPLKTKAILVLGAGKMAKLALEHIQKIGGAKEIVVLNRSPHRVIEFSDKYKIDKSIPFESVYEAMNDIDIVIAATGAPHFIVFAEQFKGVRKDSTNPLFIFDISMPRNVDSEFGKLENVKLMDIDNLQTIYNQTTNTDSQDLKQAHEIIQQSINRFYEEVEKQNIDPIIKRLKEKFETIRTEKLLKLKRAKSTFSSEELDYITKNIINTILHEPIKNLKDSKFYGSQGEKVQILRDLFEI